MTRTTTPAPATARRSRVRINLPRTRQWRCGDCDTWNAPTDRTCHCCDTRPA